MAGILPAVFPAAITPAQGPGPNAVEIVAVETRDVAPTIRLVGTVYPRLRTTVAAEVAGLVIELSVEAGDAVTAGQAICRLRDDVRRHAHAEAAASEERFERALVEWRALVERAEFERRRLGELRGEGQGTEREYVFAKADFDAATARLQQGESELKGRKAAAAMLADNLARTEIRAPFDGFVVAKRTERGAWLVEGGPVVDMIALDVARVRVSVPESAAPYCKPGTKANVFVEAVGREFAGRIGRLVPDADSKARTFPIEIDVPNPETELKAGMFARAAVPSGPAGPRLVVPKDAVVTRGSETLIFVVRQMGEGPPTASPTPVRVLSEILDEVAVAAEGLGAGDAVVVRGNENMLGPTPVKATPRARGSSVTQPVAAAATSQPTIERPEAMESRTSAKRG